MRKGKKIYLLTIWVCVLLRNINGCNEWLILALTHWIIKISNKARKNQQKIDMMLKRTELNKRKIQHTIK